MSKIEDSLEKAVRLRAEPLPVKEKNILLTPNPRIDFEDKDKQPHLGDYLEVLIRRKWVVLAFLIPVVITVTVVSFLMKPTYKSTATIQIKNVRPNVTITEDFYREISNSEYYETQYKILNSRNLAERVVKKLSVVKMTEPSNAVPTSYKNESQEDIESGGIQISTSELLSGLEIEPVKKSQLVNVNYESHDPVIASYVANAVADEYIAFTLESRLDPTQQATERLKKEVADMRAKLETSEQQLNQYISESRIYLNSKDNVYNNSITSEITDLSGELNSAIADRISKEAIYKEVDKSGVDYGFVLQNPLIQSLTKDYIKMESEYSNLLQIHKPEYPRMRRLNEQMEQMKARIAAEEQKIIDTLKSDYQLALKKEKYLSTAIDKLRQEVSILQDKVVQIQILKRDVDTNSELYNGLLQRLKEVGVSAALTESNVQVLDRARVPKSPFKPQKGMNIAMSLVFGLFGGIFLAFFVEYFDRTIKSPNDIEQRAALPVLGMVPVSGVNPKEITYVKSDNNDLFTEAFRSLGTYLRFTNDSRPPKQILVTSSLAGEGKTLLSVNTAKSLTGFLGNGIIIDADFRRPNVHTFFNLDNSTGLSSFLTGSTEFDETIKKSPLKGLDVISSGPMPPNPSELLNSSRMKDLIDRLSATYNFVIIDSAPVLGLSDSLILSAFVESVIVVVRAGHTPGDALTQTYKILDGVNANILGVVINGVGARARYGYTYYHRAYATDKK